MSTSIQNTTPTESASSGDWQPRTELVEAMRRIATIAEDDETAVISDTEITFQNRSQRTTISATPVGVEAIDGYWISERIEIRTPLDAFEDFDEERLAVINTFATTGAIVRDADGHDAVVSSLPVFEVDTVALADLYTALIANGALMHLIGPLCAAFQISGRRDEFPPAQLALPGWDDPSYWDASDFEYAKEGLRAKGVWANAGPRGLTAEFAWEEGASSAMLGDCTSLLQIHADQPHPSAGNGLLYRLSLPVNFAADEAHRCAAVLNRYEVNGVDTPPFFGAWCSPPNSTTLSFVGFWPNRMYQRGTVANIASWCAARSRIARQVIGNGTLADTI